MSPDQIDTVINAVAAAYYTARPYVPGLLLAVAVWALVWVCRLACRAWRAAGRKVAEILDRHHWQQSASSSDEPADVWDEADREEMRLHSAYIDAAPLIPTTPGSDKKALRKCRAIMRATAREEARR